MYGVSSPTVKEGCLVDALVEAKGRVAEAALADARATDTKLFP